MQVKQQK